LCGAVVPIEKAVVGLELGVVAGDFVDESTTFYFLERWRVLLFCIIQNYIYISASMA
jgi:hypothetical protein